MSMIPHIGRRIALVGGAGFIGHHLAMALKRSGADVHVIDGLQVNNLGAIGYNQEYADNRQLYLRFALERLNMLNDAKIPLHVLDARDYSALARTLGAISPQVIVHLAAVSHANRSNKDPYSTFDHSLRTLENALDSARGTTEHFIYFSSSMVYGNFPGSIVTEETPCDPLGIYGALKFAGEKLVIAYRQVFGLEYTIIRPSALYGERCVSRRVGQVFVENALRGRTLTVSGTGTDSLDFTYIDDVVNGMLRVIENTNSRDQVFNMTFGNARSVSDMIDILRANFPKLEVDFTPKDKLMPERGTLVMDKAKSLIDHTPQFPLDVGYAKYIDWYKSFGMPDLSP
jgi:nucleoside-diphosphate-sugar epimerase